MFWIVAGGEVLLALAALSTDLAIRTKTVPGSNYRLWVEYVVPIVIILLGELIAIVAALRNPVAYAIGLALLLVAPPLYGGPVREALTVFVEFETSPSRETLQAGHGFTRRADQALAGAIVARDAAKVASLAPAANLNVLGTRFDAYGPHDITFMDLALQEGGADPDVVAALLRAGADPSQGNLLGFVIDHKNERLLRVMMEAGVDMNNLKGNRWSPRFFYVAKWPEGLALLLDHGANPETEDSDGRTVLMLAVHMEEWQTIDVLLAHGARTDDAAHRLSLRQFVSDKIKQIHERGGEIPPPLAALAAHLH